MRMEPGRIATATCRLKSKNILVKSTNYRKRTLSVAPMMDWTDRHCRMFHRQITRHTWLYTEMVTTGALVYEPGNVPNGWEWQF